MPDMDEEIPFLEKPHRRKRATWRLEAVAPWVLVALLSLYITFNELFLQNSSRYSKKPLWTSSDFVSARSAIKSTVTTFTSSLDFIDPKHIYRIFDPSGRVYIGNASTDIDQAWDELILPADIYITDEEAATMPQDNQLYRSSETGKFKIELEVFHSLHCLNMIRKRVYSDSYPEMLTDNARIHVDHCIESLRELIMCEGNMTPIPIEWSEKGERINPNYAQRHSCRNFAALKTWTKERVDNQSIV